MAKGKRRGNGEGSVWRRKDGRWEGRVSLPMGKRRSVYGKTRAEAARKLVRAIRDAQDGRQPVDERATVGAFLDRWLEAIGPQVRPRTWDAYESHVRLHLKPALGRIRLARLATADVDLLLADKLAAGLSPTTVNRIRATLRRALGQAERWGAVGRNVAKLSMPAKERRFRVNPLTAEQARALLASTAGDRLHALWALTLATGLRQGEALALQWDAVDLDAGTLHVRSSLQRVSGGGWSLAEPKSERAVRTLSLPAFAVATLKAHRAAQARARLASGDGVHDLGFVFTTGRGTPLDASNVTHSLQRALAAAGLPRQRFHDLRHACASFLLSEGESLRTVMEQLGHSQIALTANVYGHVMPEALRDAADKLDAVLGQS